MTMETRNYNLSDPDMTTFSDTYRGHFTAHQPEFAALDSDLGDPTFLPDWEAAILASLAVPTAETRDDLLQDRTQGVQDTVKAIRLHVKTIKYFAQKAFVNDPALYDALGFDDYADAYDNQQKLKHFLTNMHTLANGDLNAALLAQNCPQALIDNTLTLRDALLTTDQAQNTFRDTETVDTNARVLTHNHTWSFAQKVRSAAEVIYDDNPVLFNLFLFPRRTENQEVFNVVGTVSHSVTGDVLPAVAIEVLGMGISTLTDQDGSFGLALMSAGDHTLRLTLAGHETLDVSFTIVDPTTPTVVNAVMTPTP